MHLHSCRRQAIAAVLVALLPIAGCESEGNSSSVSMNASQAARDAVGEENIDEVSSESEGEADPVSETPESALGGNIASDASVEVAEPEAAGNAAAGASQLTAVEEKIDPSQFPGGIIPASPNAEPLPGGPRLLVPERNFRAEGRPRALRVTYDDLDLLKVLNMGDPLPENVVEQFPDWLKELDGKTVRLRGFMYPAYQQMLSAFILTRDTGVCCFGPNPKVYYLVGVKLKEGTEVRYIENRPFDVVGTFHIEPRYVDGTWYQLYKISDATVID